MVKGLNSSLLDAGHIKWNNLSAELPRDYQACRRKFADIQYFIRNKVAEGVIQSFLEEVCNEAFKEMREANGSLKVLNNNALDPNLEGIVDDAENVQDHSQPSESPLRKSKRRKKVQT